MMKHRILIAALLLFFSAPAAANIASSKHNLSAGGTGTIKATSETELCIFCHIPHNARPAAPLWNHMDTAVAVAGYTMYNSDYLTRAGYATPADVGQRSRLCLSCHDGTVAVGSVYMIRGVAQTSPLGMSGVDAAGKMPSTAAGYLGTDLRNDHPVSIKYDTGSFTTIGLRGMELKTPAPSINPKPYQGVKLYGSVSGSIQGYVECTSCHDPHNGANAKFLVVSTTNGALCTACHNKTGWTGSVHQQASAVTVNNPAGETQPIPAGTIAQAACMACHKNHSGGGTPYLLRKSEENTCFNGASTSCHGSSATTTEKPTQNRIQSVLNKARAHPTTTNTLLEKHINLDVLTPAQLGANNRHAECPDCHNPHQATKLPQRVAATSWYPSSITINSNRVSNSGALTGVPGVSPPTATANWYVRAAAAYTVKEKAEFEYEICYKCHSSYSLGEAGPVIIGLTGPSGVTITDQSWEFSPANRSGHPVEAALGTSRRLAVNQLNTASPNWSANRGNQTMYCSDCHGADNETGTDPKGPHGSNSNFMLKGPNKTWPGTFSLYNRLSGQGTAAGLLCLNCHPLTLSESVNNVHSLTVHQRAEVNNGWVEILCVRCHTAVPHGSKLSRLIAYNTSGAPYGNQSWLRGFKKATSPTGYSESNCQIISPTPTGCGDHSNAVSGAE